MCKPSRWQTECQTVSLSEMSLDYTEGYNTKIMPSPVMSPATNAPITMNDAHVEGNDQHISLKFVSSACLDCWDLKSEYSLQPLRREVVSKWLWLKTGSYCKLANEGGHSVDAAMFAVWSEVDNMLKHWQRTVTKSNTVLTHRRFVQSSSSFHLCERASTFLTLSRHVK